MGVLWIFSFVLMTIIKVSMFIMFYYLNINKSLGMVKSETTYMIGEYSITLTEYRLKIAMSYCVAIFVLRV